MSRDRTSSRAFAAVHVRAHGPQNRDLAKKKPSSCPSVIMGKDQLTPLPDGKCAGRYRTVSQY